MTPKELVKLAKACRAAGIRTYKCGDVEFTLDDAVSPAKNTQVDVQGNVENEEYTDDQLLNWSVLEVPSPNSSN